MEELKKITASLYCRVLELASEVAYYECLSSDTTTAALADAKLRAQLERSEFDRKKTERLRERFRKSEQLLQASRLTEQRAEQQRKEMEETTTKLTEWNTQLETRVGELDEEVRETLKRAREDQEELEAQLVQSTRKRIQLQQEYTTLEERLQQLSRQNRELDDVKRKFQQENAILKTKLSQALARSRSVPRSPLSPRPRAASKSPVDRLGERLADMEMMEEVELRGKPSLTDIFKSSMSSKPMMP